MSFSDRSGRGGGSALLLIALIVSPLLLLSSVAQAQSGGLLGMSLPGDFRAFAADSPWNQPIPADPEVATTSALMIPNLAKTAKVLKGDLTQWSFPLFVIAAAESPLHSVTTNEPLHPSIDPDGNGLIEAVPLPEGVWPDPQKDGHMILVDPQRRVSWEFSRARRLPDGNWHASRLARWDLDGPGYAPPFNGRRWWTFGALGSGMPLLAGLIRPEEIERGEIRHALLCATPVNRRALLSGLPTELCSPPAARSDGQYDGLEFIPVGARLQLDPTLDLDSLGLSPATKIVAKAMQVYGLFNGVGSEDFKIFFQNLGSDGGRWQGIADFGDLQKIPLERFRVLSCQTVTRGH